MSELQFEVVASSDGLAAACHRLRDNDASLVALQYAIIFYYLISRFNKIDIEDEAKEAFVEGMRHNSHLRGLA